MYDVNVPSSFIAHQTGGVVTNFLRLVFTSGDGVGVIKKLMT